MTKLGSLGLQEKDGSWPSYVEAHLETLAGRFIILSRDMIWKWSSGCDTLGVDEKIKVENEVASLHVAFIAGF